MNHSKRTRGSAAARRRAISTPLGAAFLLLAAIGFVAVILFAVSTVHRLLDPTAKYERYARFINPVVMMDPVPFSRVENIEQNVIQQSALWAALTGENRGSYTYDDTGMLLVPASDVDVAAVKLFGPNVSIEHRSFEDTDASYLFDPEIDSYRVPLTAKIAYSAEVVDVESNGDVVTLTVGYIAPGNVWSTDIRSGQGSETIPEKYMYYDLTEWSEGYYISAVRDAENLPSRD
ncbi:MAG: hypothetical protein DBX44_05515 [Oscillospiraceae bacterium]|nr:MAG: hypothetical protein DBX44_05515 [Oscillospiraceae bacterium]